ncbi:MAG: S1 RNA-binding domain-containing protein, partial [Cytophagia bacterium]
IENQKREIKILQTKEARTQELVAEIENQKRDIKTLREERAATEERNRLSQTKLAEQDTKTLDYETKIEHLNVKISSLSGINSICQRMEDEIQTYQEQIRDKERRIDLLTRGVIDNQVLQNEVLNLKSELSSKDRQASTQTTELAALRKLEIEVISLRQQIKEKDKTITDQVSTNEALLLESQRSDYEIQEQKKQIMSGLEKGQVLEGVVKNITSYGVFVDLGGVDGLIHITDLSWGRINHPNELLKLDQRIKVVVLDFDEEKKRISLGMKQLYPHPWASLGDDVQVGSKLKGKIVNVADYGAFLEVIPGVEGLIHVSEMSWSQHLRNPQDFLKVGDEIDVVVLTIEREEKKMSLGIKQLVEDPWTKKDLTTKYAINTKHKGVVRNLTTFGLFLELEEGIDGLVHVSDLSWTRKVKHPSEFVKVGDTLEVVVLELDIENKRLALGHKQLEQNPWDTFETIFIPGTIHRCTVTQKIEKGALLELPYGVEGFCVQKHLAKQDGSEAELGEALDFVVVEFVKDDRKIVLSHLRTYKKDAELPKEEVAVEETPVVTEKVAVVTEAVVAEVAKEEESK